MGWLEEDEGVGVDDGIDGVDEDVDLEMVFGFSFGRFGSVWAFSKAMFAVTLVLCVIDANPRMSVAMQFNIKYDISAETMHMTMVKSAVDQR